jgi:PilZ domain
VNQCVKGLIGRVGRRPFTFVAAATGERIVAFGRVGKPLEIPFLRSICASIGRRRPPGVGVTSMQRFLKPHAVGCAGGISDMALLSSKKRDTRKSLSQPGWITLEGGFAARQCVVQDMSATGAKVTIDDPNTLPAKLRLAFSRDARTGRRCEVVWRRGKSVGVKFVR